MEFQRSTILFLRISIKDLFNLGSIQDCELTHLHLPFTENF